MKVTLRERNQGGKTSLYLDYYHKGKRQREYLGLYLNPNAKTRIEKDDNKNTLQLARAIEGKRRVEIQNNTFGFSNEQRRQGSFFKYIQRQADNRIDSPGNYGNWNAMIKHLKDFSGSDLTFSDIDRKFVEDFRRYLDKDAESRNSKGLSQNSKQSYFNKFKAALKQAVKDDILKTNPSSGVSPFKQADVQREFLTLEELQKAANTECEPTILKKAFIFSCLTGLRWSDINKLKWSEIQHSESMGYYLRFRQQNSKGTDTQPISEQAFKLLGERSGDEHLVFNELKYMDASRKLKKWITEAGINKKITFHCARHTYATLQLTMGTDIYTVSKLLGHKELKTTQVYANIIDQKKKEAANKIQIDL